MADERLLAPVDELDRAPGVGASIARGSGSTGPHASKRPAHAGEVDAHLLGREAEAQATWSRSTQPLGGDVDVDAALAVRNREPGLGAEECLVLDPDLVDALDETSPSRRDRRAG
jgi:hypothetical protein